MSSPDSTNGTLSDKSDKISENWTPKSNCSSVESLQNKNSASEQEKEYALAVFLDYPSSGMEIFSRVERLKLFKIEERWEEYCLTIEGLEEVAYNGLLATDRSEFLAFKCEYVCGRTADDMKQNFIEKYKFLETYTKS